MGFQVFKFLRSLNSKLAKEFWNFPIQNGGSTIANTHLKNHSINDKLTISFLRVFTSLLSNLTSKSQNPKWRKMLQKSNVTWFICTQYELWNSVLKCGREPFYRNKFLSELRDIDSTFLLINITILTCNIKIVFIQTMVAHIIRKGIFKVVRFIIMYIS